MRAGVRALGRGLLLAVSVTVLGCGSLNRPTEPPPATQTVPNDPTAILGAPQPKPTPTPTPDPTQPSPQPTPSDEGGSACGDPLPPPLAKINVVVHIMNGDTWTLDSTPLVGPDQAFCAKIGFTDGRQYCAVRPEGNPQRYDCEAYVLGSAKDTGRPGPTWYFHGGFCTGRSSGCQNHPENQFQLLVYTGGTFEACGNKNDVCGDVTADR